MWQARFGERPRHRHFQLPLSFYRSTDAAPATAARGAVMATTKSGVPALRVGFIGGGAVGLYIGAHLAQDGHDVTIIDGWAENVDAIRDRGIRVVPPSCDPPFTQTENIRALHIHETHMLRDDAEFDIGFVAMKIHDTRWAASLIDRFVTPSGFVVASQNCWPDEVVADVVGDGRAVGCVMSTISVGMWEAGLVERAGSATGRLRGYTVLRPAEHTPGGGVSPRTVALAKMLEVVDTAEASPDLWSERWSKLCLNAMSNTPQAMSGMAGPEVLHTAEGRRLTIMAAGETVKVGVAKGLIIGKVQGRPAADWALALEDKDMYDELDEMLTPSTPPPAVRSQWDEKGTQENWKVSMPQDIAKQRRSEIEEMTGLVCREGEALGIPTPVAQAITETVSQIDRGERTPGADNLRLTLVAAGVGVPVPADAIAAARL
jgi:2-dehydropantoate 2-reductase